ncbi:MAG: serine/threonine protein kinase, partial [Polyangiaceae bacterium]|nr:serine/threonine protein kinase [Polyangiaceae bacterium]
MSIPPERNETAEAGDLEPLQSSKSNEMFGKYHLFASLGRGGMADVYLAVARGALGAHKIAVVKKLRSNLSSDAGFRQMFVDEARLATRLNHPNVVHTYEVGEENGDYCIAMEYLEGQPFNRVIRETIRRGKPFDQRMVSRIIVDALAGLQYAHELADYDGTALQIVHRDVSPHNIFVTYAGLVKIVDFGIAKAASNSTETEVGILKGKVAYMSPEQAVGGAVDHRSDLFSMGIVLWEALAQKRLFGGETAAATLHRLVNERIPPVSLVRTDVDPELEAIVAKSLEKNPAHRFQSAREMREALERFLTSVGNVRTEGVGDFITSMFGETRSTVQGKIQRYMQQINVASNTAELAALNRAAIQGVDGRLSSSGLLTLGTNGSGSGSGVIPNYGMGATLPPRNDIEKETRKNRMLVMVLVATLFALASVSVMLFVISRSKVETPVTSTDTPPRAAPSSDHEPALDASVAIVEPTITAGAKIDAASAPTGLTHVAASPGHGTKRPVTNPTVTPVEAVDPGYFTVTTLPWTSVSIDGKKVGDVPVRRVALAPGSHTVVFENPEKGIKQTIRVEIKSGETLNKG